MSKNKMISVVSILVLVVLFVSLYFIRTNKDNNSNQVTERVDVAVEVEKVDKGNITKVRSFTGVVKDITGTLNLNVIKDDLENFSIDESFDTDIELKDEKSEGIAVVSAISPIVDPVTNQFTITLKVSKDGGVTPGSFVRVLVPYNEKDNVIIINKNSIIREGDKSFVFIIKDNIATKVEITTEIENDTYVEVTSGISEGDMIVIKGKEFIKDKEKVNVVGGVENENN